MNEPQYVELDWNEDFSLTAHVDSDGQQRFALVGYIKKYKDGELYRAPLIPELFFGADGTQLETWSQHLTAGDHVVLSRDGGNPHVPDHELNWIKVSEHQQHTATPTMVVVAKPMDLPINAILLVVSGIALAGSLYYIFFKKR